jgi:hypothetical protein
MRNNPRMRSAVSLYYRHRRVKHYFVEQDETPASPFSSIKLSIDYLKRLEF